MRILVAEDDDMIAKALSAALTAEGFTVDLVKDGETALDALTLGGHGLVLLDLGLPKLDGATVLERARRAGTSVPVLIVTARDGISDRIKGLDLGADDYIVKPFEIDELLARMRAVIRRHAGQAQSQLIAGEVTVDIATHTVSYRGASHLLPAREFALIQALAQRPGMILGRTLLEDRLYGWGEEVESNAIDVLIHYIRKKFDKDIIRNVRGAGWMIPKGP